MHWERLGVAYNERTKHLAVYHAQICGSSFFTQGLVLLCGAAYISAVRY